MNIKGVTTALAGVGVDGHSRPFFDDKIIVHTGTSPEHRSAVCTRLSTYQHARVGADSRRSGSEDMCSLLGDGRRDAQVPVLGDEARQIELLGEAHPDDAGPRIGSSRTVRARTERLGTRGLGTRKSRTKNARTERLLPVWAEGPVIETAPIAQAGAVGTEAQGGDEDEVEADRGGEQLSGGQQRAVLGRLADSPSALRSQAGHRTSDSAEHQRLAHWRDDRHVDGAARGEKPIERRVEVRLSGQRRIGKERANRCIPNEVPRGVGHGACRCHGVRGRHGPRVRGRVRGRLGGSDLRRRHRR